MPGQTVIDHVVFLHVLEQGGPDVGHVPFFPVGEALEDGGGVVNGPDQLDLRDIELLRGLEENLPGQDIVTQFLGQFFSHFLAAAVGSS